MLNKILCVANGYPRQSCASVALRLAATCRARLAVLYIIDRGYADILGDEWISTARARRFFYRYLGNELKKGAELTLEGIDAAGKEWGVEIETLVRTGVPEKVIVDCCSTGPGAPDLLVLPYPPGKGVEGALRLNPGRILGRVPCPVLTVPPASFKTPPARR
ncbi:MAG: universal stress protein [Desulfotomaculales bacterium]